MGPDHFAPRSSVPIIDKGQQIIALLAGQPIDHVDSDWGQVVQEAEKAMRAAHMKCTRWPENRWGTFLVLPVGVSFGGGQEVPFSH